MVRPPLLLVLAVAALGASEPVSGLDLRTPLGLDPGPRIHLVPPGIWRGRVGTTQAPTRAAARARRIPGATVEVLDFMPPGDARAEAFAGFSLGLHQRLEAAFRTPPADYAAQDLSLFMSTDPAHPERLAPTLVQSLQNRFNALPPEGSPLREP